jgi:3-hydroxyisobutyrate dehydrogenase-like beta-hydroxyacid dehydrogenase
MSVELRVAMFGLGEAGGSVSADLARRGAAVHAYDPASRDTPPGVVRHDRPERAVEDADVILSLTAAKDARGALVQALDDIPASAVYADLSTASAALKRDLAAGAESRSLRFADVALMSTVPGKGISTPQLVAGSGAARYAELLSSVGAPVTDVGPRAGDAAVRKLLRSVVMKGLAAILIEALEAGHAAGLQDWLWDHVTAEIVGGEEAFLRRLVEGTGPHAERRLHEMEAARELLEELGVESGMTAGTVGSLSRALVAGTPPVPRGPVAEGGVPVTTLPP